MHDSVVGLRRLTRACVCLRLRCQLLITDFGLSMNRGVDWHTNKVGSPAYVAPEVLLHHIYTPACDVWAMGVILYILLVGFPPFYGDSDADVRSTQTRGCGVRGGRDR